MFRLAQRPLIAVMVFLIGLVISAHAQLGTGTVNGTVVDSTGRSFQEQR
jgi:type 1 fimbria pilin